MKKLIAILTALCLILALAACSGETNQSPAEETAEKEPYEISVVLKSLSIEYWNYVKAGCVAAAADLGVEVTVVGPSAESEIEAQVAMIEQQIGAGCDAIVCSPNDAGAAANALQAAIDIGVPVLAVDTDVGMEGQISFVGTSNEEAAYEGGMWGCERVGENAGAVIIYGQEGDNTSNMRRAGYTRACEESGVTVLAALSGQNTTDGATKAMEDMLSAYPGQVDIVFCHNDNNTIGVMNVCKTAGLDDIVIVGFDGEVAAVEQILQGNVDATIAQRPFEMGYQVVEYAVMAIKGEEVPAVVNTPVQIVTIENGQEYLDNLAK